MAAAALLGACCWVVAAAARTTAAGGRVSGTGRRRQPAHRTAPARRSRVPQRRAVPARCNRARPLPARAGAAGAHGQSCIAAGAGVGECGDPAGAIAGPADLPVHPAPRRRDPVRPAAADAAGRWAQHGGGHRTVRAHVPGQLLRPGAAASRGISVGCRCSSAPAMPATAWCIRCCRWGTDWRCSSLRANARARVRGLCEDELRRQHGHRRRTGRRRGQGMQSAVVSAIAALPEDCR